MEFEIREDDICAGRARFTKIEAIMIKTALTRKAQQIIAGAEATAPPKTALGALIDSYVISNNTPHTLTANEAHFRVLAHEVRTTYNSTRFEDAAVVGGFVAELTCAADQLEVARGLSDDLRKLA